MNLATLFGNLQEHEMELKRIADDEEDGKKKKTLALKIEEEKDSHSKNEEMSLIIQNFRRFMKWEKQQEEQQQQKRENPLLYLHDFNVNIGTRKTKLSSKPERKLEKKIRKLTLSEMTMT